MNERLYFGSFSSTTGYRTPLVRCRCGLTYGWGADWIVCDNCPSRPLLWVLVERLDDWQHHTRPRPRWLWTRLCDLWERHLLSTS